MLFYKIELFAAFVRVDDFRLSCERSEILAIVIFRCLRFAFKCGFGNVNRTLLEAMARRSSGVKFLISLDLVR